MACIRKRRGKWVVDFRNPDGKRRWKTFDTKKAAEDELTDLKVELKQGTYRDPATLPTFAVVATDWLAVKRDHPPATFQFWQTQVERHFIPAFGDRRIDLVTAKAIETWRNAKRDGTDGHERLARSTINQQLQTLTAILDYAVMHRYLTGNPGKQVARVRRERHAGAAGANAVDPKQVLTAEHAAAVIDAADPGLMRTFIAMALHTGARRGELLALTWSHVDIEAATLRIERSLSWSRGTERGYGTSIPVFGPPKSDSSYRTLEVAPELLHELKEWKLRTHYSRPEDLVFPNSLGKPLHGAFLNRGLHDSIRAANADRPPAQAIPMIGPHELRHTFASLLISLGYPVSQVANMLGHKNPDITLKVYTHWFKSESSAEAMAGLAAAIRRPGSGSRMVATPAVAGALAAK
jgi:integrase